MLHSSAARLASNALSCAPRSPALQRHELAALRQRERQAYLAIITSSRQRCREARALLAVATERLTCSRDFLATSRGIARRRAAHSSSVTAS